MMAFGGTAAIFLGLSGYALTTKRDFSFLGGFLMVGILVAFLAGIAALVFSIPALSLAVSAMFILLMSGFILFQTSQLVHEPNTNYILATVSLYVSIYNLFTVAAASSSGSSGARTEPHRLESFIEERRIPGIAPGFFVSGYLTTGNVTSARKASRHHAAPIRTGASGLNAPGDGRWIPAFAGMTVAASTPAIVDGVIPSFAG